MLSEIVSPDLKRFDPRLTPKGWFLCCLEWITRIHGRRGVFWLIFMVLGNWLIYAKMLEDGVLRWHVAAALPGTPLYFLHLDALQPTIAGIWAVTVFFPMTGYLVMPVVRLAVVFICLSKSIATDAGLRISPSHPDGIGGLRSVGQVALFFSLFDFSIGLDLAALTTNELVIKDQLGKIAQVSSSMLVGVVILWAMYLVIGTLLFFMPLAPLRAQMARVKVDTLRNLSLRRAAIEAPFLPSFDRSGRILEGLEDMLKLDELTQRVEEMAVWPFDRKTFLRYTGLLLSPIATIVASQLPSILIWLRGYVG